MRTHIQALIVSLLIVFALAESSTTLLAQPSGTQWLDMKNLDIQPHLPKYLLSRKSVVFVSVPRSQKDPNVREDWKGLSAKVHNAFRQMKIDAVAYYYLDDVFASPDVSESFAREMTEREIKYIIVLEQSPKNEAGVESFKITLSAYNDAPTFISEKQKAWQTEGPVLDVILSEMRKDVYRAEMELENYLILDIPEFFNDTQIIKGRRIPTYALDLKVDKLVVPKFQKYIMEDSAALDAATRQKIAAYNLEVDRKNERLIEIMKDYPLDYVLFDSSNDDDIYNAGYQFSLLTIHGTGKTVKQILNFDTDPYETDYVTIQASSALNTLPVDAVVYKYYVKHVYTKDVYLGSRWDADLTWEQALKNFIFHMKDILKVQ
ncbi:hypothetical protein N7E81_05555 [Reichenbachiella carrageenanivorans]|uniref:Uncharacterized protein n=1 Tax=Reichenbachiella carrageenanivorans TaxID=2979869 RepID=A0ABY6D324_9BACT|nr:hypothetical protein [Reichenbachiella carrageenanivorans]UXX80564.1 hypothetical protein N7E81_05555 [Reichenbachiella carrageenanivorans]